VGLTVRHPSRKPPFDFRESIYNRSPQQQLPFLPEKEKKKIEQNLSGQSWELIFYLLDINFISILYL
jgi:hypothetical protein